MSLFGKKKETCILCGKPASGFMKITTADGAICPQCRIQFSVLADNWPLKTKEQALQHIQYRQQNLVRYKAFKATDQVDDYLLADRNSQTWCSPKVQPCNPDIFNFSDVLDFSLVEDGTIVTKGGIGSAVVGGALFGGVGAIVGSNVGKKSSDVVKRMSVIVDIRCDFASRLEIPLITTETKRSSSMYQNSKIIGERLTSLLTMMSHSAPSTPATSGGAPDPSDQILKLKGLLDAGAITQEEFELSKKKILGI